MATLYRTTLRDIGAEAGEMLDAGMLILFALGAPPELAEVSVLHEAQHEMSASPAPGDTLRIGDAQFRITAVGSTAWQKIGELGHVVFSFNGAVVAERPGEICIEPTTPEQLRALLQPGAELEILSSR